MWQVRQFPHNPTAENLGWAPGSHFFAPITSHQHTFWSPSESAVVQVGSSPVLPPPPGPITFLQERRDAALLWAEVWLRSWRDVNLPRPPSPQLRSAHGGGASASADAAQLCKEFWACIAPVIRAQEDLLSVKRSLASLPHAE